MSWWSEMVDGLNREPPQNRKGFWGDLARGGIKLSALSERLFPMFEDVKQFGGKQFALGSALFVVLISLCAIGRKYRVNHDTINILLVVDAAAIVWWWLYNFGAAVGGNVVIGLRRAVWTVMMYGGVAFGGGAVWIIASNLWEGHEMSPYLLVTIPAFAGVWWIGRRGVLRLMAERECAFR